MQELLKVIEQVRKRMGHYSEGLQGNELLTRYVLIDPILRILGWDTEDPEQVLPEFSTEHGRPDYALLDNNRDPFIMVEAKPLGSDLNKARDSGFKYCWQNKVPYYLITDGNVWELHNMREIGGEKIFQVRLSQDNLGDAARRLLAIWRPAIPEVGTARRIEWKEKKDREKISLSELVKQIRSKQRPPEHLHFPDGKIEPLKNWRGLLITTAKWALPQLQEQHRLPLGKLITRSPQEMRASRLLADGWYIETSYSAKGCVREARRILRAIGIDPTKVSVNG